MRPRAFVRRAWSLRPKNSKAARHELERGEELLALFLIVIARPRLRARLCVWLALDWRNKRDETRQDAIAQMGTKIGRQASKWQRRPARQLARRPPGAPTRGSSRKGVSKFEASVKPREQTSDKLASGNAKRKVKSQRVRLRLNCCA